MAQKPGADKIGAEKAGSGENAGAPGAAAAASSAPAEAGKALRTMRNETNSSIKKKHIPPTLEQIMKEVAPDPEGSGAGGGMLRLERRMQVLERAFTDIVDRHEKSLRDRAESLSAVEEGVSALGRRLQQSEEHQADAVAELRTMIAETSMRLNMLEMANPAVLEANPLLGANAPVESVEDLPSDDRDDTGSISVSREHEHDAVDEEGSYISAARRAAITAHTNTEPAGKRTNPGTSGHRARLLLLGCVAPAVIGAVALFALNRHTVTAEPVRIPALAGMPQAVFESAPQAAQQVAPAPNFAPPASAITMEQLQEIANAGDAKAARDVALRYLTGDGVSVDTTEAAGWFLRASYAGEATAQYWLATLYARGQGVPADADQATHWYETAAKGGNARAMHSFALANLEGWGREQNAAEAARWFTRAAELGFVDSAFNLGVLYERGDGVPKNLTQAYTWYAIAGAQGDRQAESRLAVIAKALPPVELAGARSAAVAFKPASPDANANLTTVSARSGG